MSYLNVEQLKKTYDRTKIIDGLSFSLDKGAFVSLLGPSGSGKTTILRCIAGLETPDADSGPITLGDTSLSSQSAFLPPEKRDMGMVFQSYAVWPHLDVFENVAFPLRVRKTPDAAVQSRVRDVLALVKLTPYERRYAHELSGGQQQRVALARALVATPRLLLLDEPLSNLDALLREDLGAEIRRLQRSLGLTTILVTHDQKEALSLSDRIIVLDQGAIAADGAPETLYSRPPSDFVASFLAGGQRLTLPSGVSGLFLPRRWRLDPRAPLRVKIATRIYLGSEYEYLAEIAAGGDALRFFSRDRHEMGAEVGLAYAD